MVRIFEVENTKVMISNDAGKLLDFALAFEREESDPAQVAHLRMMIKGCLEEWGMLQAVVCHEHYALMVRGVPNGVEAEVTSIIEEHGGREVWLQ